ncbi:peptidoglycan DD-metalloendopeptidase family protein [Actinomyces gaoshouyii]|uniref:M23ase beta-sheet core domain-containing protein n=1 Tax=Actinomyces gaoshouyii TaxID=1960083 RepID=A0A8H9H9J8_9ACTO|nr:peptidoglycan DD-metalloendopeptidase family protein [Actinomyces gaoshouyii]GGO98692.1 hypothetical protein GCM10011612_14190 [Actinomyces gaoshouyii]
MSQPPLTRRQRRDAERAAQAALAEAAGSGRVEGAIPDAGGSHRAPMASPSRVPAAPSPGVPTLTAASGPSAPAHAAATPRAPLTRSERLRQARLQAEREAANGALSAAGALRTARTADVALQFPDPPPHVGAIGPVAALPESAMPRARGPVAAEPASPAPRALEHEAPELWDRGAEVERPSRRSLSAVADAPAMVVHNDARESTAHEVLKPFGEPAADAGVAIPETPAPRPRRGSDGPTVEIPASEQPTPADFDTDSEGAEAIVAPAPARRRTLRGTTSRVAVLAVLAVATVVAPLQARVLGNGDGPSSASAAASTYAGTAIGTPSSVSAGVLGSDAGFEPGTDAGLSNAPDAATLARIREAYDNAAVTCAARSSGASGNTSAFTKAPELFYPMVSGTYELSSDYGYRIHPTLGYQKLHAGQDMSAPVGTPIYAIASGTVVEAGMVDGTGTVTIEHNINGTTWYSSYLHMYGDGIYVKKGDTVGAGKLIAGVGSTGYSTGPHLHFEIRTKNDTADSSTVNPWTWLQGNTAAELTTNCS